MDRIFEIVRALPAGATWLFASATLALVGSMIASASGLSHLAHVGEAGFVVAIGVIGVFCNWKDWPRLDRG